MFLSRHRGKLPWIVYKMPWTLNWEGDSGRIFELRGMRRTQRNTEEEFRKYTQRITREEPSKRKTQERLKRNTQGNRRKGKNALWNHGYLIHTLSSTNMQMFFFLYKIKPSRWEDLLLEKTLHDLTDWLTEGLPLILYVMTIRIFSGDYNLFQCLSS